MSFIDNLSKELNTTTTYNGAESFKSTLDSNLDLFGTIGSMRHYDDEVITSMFSDAYCQDSLNAVKMAFYARDVREGLGERSVFRVIIKWLALNSPESLRKNVKWIPFFGRWDDLYTLVGTPLEKEVIEVMKNELEANGYDSLMWKWLKSPNTSNQKSCELGRWTAINVFNDSNAKNYFPVYRKMLKKGRAEIKVVESLMSAKKWEQINYESLTSYNNIRYIDAFLKNDPQRYSDYVLNSQKVNGSVLFPYDIIKKVHDLTEGYGKSKDRVSLETMLYDKLWKSLPDYEVDSEGSTIAVVDTSGSMEMQISDSSGVTALDVAVSLGMYFADRAKGEFKDTFITFSTSPTLQKVNGVNIVDKYRKILRSDWEMNTDLEAVFDLILKTAINGKMDDKDTPKRLLIMSDMQFDSCTDKNNPFSYYRRDNHKRTSDHGFIRSMKKKYAEAGYTFPQLVFWNIGDSGSFHMTKDDNNFIMISGASQNGFKAVLAGETEVIQEVESLEEEGQVKEIKTRTIDPIAAMRNTLHSERYSMIRV